MKLTWTGFFGDIKVKNTWLDQVMLPQPSSPTFSVLCDTGFHRRQAEQGEILIASAKTTPALIDPLLPSGFSMSHGGWERAVVSAAPWRGRVCDPLWDSSPRPSSNPTLPSYIKWVALLSLCFALFHGTWWSQSGALSGWVFLTGRLLHLKGSGPSSSCFSYAGPCPLGGSSVVCRQFPFCLLCDVLWFLSVNPNAFSLERRERLALCVCHPTELFAHSRNRGLAGTPLEALLPPGPCVHAICSSWPWYCVSTVTLQAHISKPSQLCQLLLRGKIVCQKILCTREEPV